MNKFIAVVITILIVQIDAHAQDEDKAQDFMSFSGPGYDRIVAIDESGTENIDTFSGQLSLSYRDAIVLGDGGFSLPIMRRYEALQSNASNFVDPTLPVFGTGWEIHFGKLTLPRSGIFCQSDTSPIAFGNTNNNPVFENARGVESRLFKTLPESVSSLGDMTSRSYHRVLCNDNGSITVTELDGTKYIFGNQAYVKSGSADFDLPRIGEEIEVIYLKSQYATEIIDRNGNAFKINYSMRDNAIPNVFRNVVFTIDSVVRESKGPLGGTTTVAEFTYNNLDDSGSVNSSPDLLLKRLEVNNLTIDYDYEQPIDGIYAYNLIGAVAVGQKAEGYDWKYSYYPSTGVGPNRVNLEEVRNSFGGTTGYTYQTIGNNFNELGVKLVAVNTKKQSGYPEWQYTFQQNTPVAGFDTTTLEGPDDQKRVYTHCSAASTLIECDGNEGTVQILDVYGRKNANTALGNSQLLHSEEYIWKKQRLISNQVEVIRAFGFRRLRPNVHTRVLGSVIKSRPDGAGTTFYTTRNYEFDQFGFAQVVIEGTSNSAPLYSADPESGNDLAPTANLITERLSKRTFSHNTGVWVLGLVQSDTLVENIVDTSGGVFAENRTITNVYDASGNLTSANVYGDEYSYGYNDKGNLLVATEPNGNKVTYSNYVLGRPEIENRSLALAGDPVLYISRIVDPVTGLISQETDALSRRIEYVHDDLARLSDIITPRTTDANVEIDYVNGFSFLQKRTISRGSSQEEASYDDFGRVARRVQSGDGVSIVVDRNYDAYGRLSFQSLPHQDTVNISTSGNYYTYDSLGRLLRERTQTTDIQTGQIETLDTTLSYEGNTEIQIDRRGNITTTVHRTFGEPSDQVPVSITQVVTIESASGASSLDQLTTVHEWTKRGDLLSTTQNGVERKFERDRKYRLKTINNPETGITTHQYDRSGNLEQVVNSDGDVTVYGYDGRNQLILEDFPDVTTSRLPSSDDITIGYYSNGQLNSVTRGDTRWIYTYDSNGSLVSESLELSGVFSKNYHFIHERDELDRLSMTTYPDGEVIDYLPDDLGRPRAVASYLTLINYHPNGYLKSALYGNGAQWSVTQNGRQLFETTQVIFAGTGSVDERYQYDANYNVENMTGTVSGSNIFEYDELNRLTGVTSGTVSKRFRYDLNNNLVAADIPSLSENTLVYNLDQQQRLTSVENLPNGVRSYDYDINGNVVADGSNLYTYNSASELVSYEGEAESALSSHIYDGNRKRVITRRDDETTVYLYSLDGKLRYEENIAAAEHSNYIYLGDHLVARNDTYTDLIGGADSDGDGITDEVEGTGDRDQDLIPNFEDEDSDGDSIPDLEEGNVDSDSDGVPDYLDWDSDNDGIMDRDELFAKNDQCASDSPNYNSEFGFVLVALQSVSETVAVVYGQRTDYSPEGDFDDDGVINAIDKDIDGDGASNEYERQFVPTDPDCDGYPSWFDVDSDDDGWGDIDELSVEGNPDIDGDGLPNFIDSDSDGIGKGDRESAPAGYANEYLQYVEFGRQTENGSVFGGVIVLKEIADTFNTTETQVVIQFPSDLDPDYVVFRAPSSNSDLNGETTYFGEGDPINGPCRQLAPPYLGSGGSSSGGISQAPRLPYCQFLENQPPDPLFFEYQFNINAIAYGQSLAGKTIVFEVTKSATPNADGSIVFLREYAGDFVDRATRLPIDFDSTKVQYVEDPGYSPQTPYLQKIRLVTAPNSNDVGELSGTCCTFFEGIPYFVTIQDQSGISTINSSGQRIAFDTENILGDRLPSFLLGLHIQGFGDTSQEIRLILSNPLDLPAFEEVFSLQTTVLEFSVQSTGSSSTPGSIRYIGPFESSRFDKSTPLKLLSSRSITPIQALAISDDEPDTDGDGIIDRIEMRVFDSPVDTDLDGIPDYKDTDSDNDGILDAIESRVNLLSPSDTDGLGTPNYRDIDSDNDGILDALETAADPDQDGLPNFLDLDSDGDFIPDAAEAGIVDGQYADTDADGIPDFVDIDSDNDNISDFIEAGPDPRNPADTDSDGIPDHLDLDSDNDGVNDADEIDDTLDTDNDGLPDAFEIANGLDPNDELDAFNDSDGDGLSNLVEYQLGTSILEIDSDSDSIPDGAENQIGSNPLLDDSSIDSDGDGLSLLEEYLNPLTIGNLIYRINAGGPVVNQGSLVWSADTSSVGEYGTLGDIIEVSGGAVQLDSTLTGSTVNTDIFNTLRESSDLLGSLEWSLPVVAGVYEVNLYFAERDPGNFSAQARTMRLSIEGNIVADEIDVYSLASIDTGTVQTHIVASDGTLDIAIDGVSGRAMLSAVSVIVADPSRLNPPNESGTIAELVSVNDWYNPIWGGGFNVTYRFVLTDNDVTSVDSTAWRIDANYVGAGEVNNAWTNGYNGGVRHGFISPDGGYGISNDVIDYKPNLMAGDSITVTFAINGAGYSAEDFDLTFVNLDDDDPTDIGAGSGPSNALFTVDSLNSWYNEDSGGGFNAILSLEITDTLLPDPTDYGWSAILNYDGPGEISTGWIDGYPGSVTVTVESPKRIQYSNEDVSWKPMLSVGDNVRLAVQVQNAPFDISHFSLTFAQ